jgi:hypothetical protein
VLAALSAGGEQFSSRDLGNWLDRRIEGSRKTSDDGPDDDDDGTAGALAEAG